MYYFINLELWLGLCLKSVFRICLFSTFVFAYINEYITYNRYTRHRNVNIEDNNPPQVLYNITVTKYVNNNYQQMPAIENNNIEPPKNNKVKITPRVRPNK